MSTDRGNERFSGIDQSLESLHLSLEGVLSQQTAEHLSKAKVEVDSDAWKQAILPQAEKLYIYLQKHAQPSESETRSILLNLQEQLLTPPTGTLAEDFMFQPTVYRGEVITQLLSQYYSSKS